ncbi:MAG TPA: hypothetical protein VFP50_18155 [Anaeromyxobacteraceae bacterium]|nr:hypothetical protein [Anaeromyxobacteraceae bacterium]
MTRFGLVLAAALAAGPAAAGEPPAPPEGHPPVVVKAGTTWTAPPGDGICLAQPAWTYQVELRRWDRERIAAAVALAEDRPLKVVAWSAGVGVAVGLVAGAILHARAH